MKSLLARRNISYLPVSFLIYTAAGSILYFVSFQILSEYTLGDQVYYRAFYASLKGIGFSEIWRNQFNHTGSAEPLYGILMWAGSNLGFDKDAYLSVFNTALFLIILRFLRLHRANAIFTVLLFSNFYILVLATGAERLKFAYIALILALLTNRRLISLALLSLSFLAHFQSLLIVVAYFSRYLAHLRVKRYVKLRKLISNLAILAVFLVATVFIIFRFRANIEGKLNAYLQTGSIAEFINILLLFAVAIIVLRNKGEAAASLLTCLVFVFLLGPDRVNMIAVSIFLFMAVQERKTHHPLTLLIMIYFSAKGFLFIESIFRFGNGFASH